MTIRNAFAAGTALVALAATTPALAAQEMSYEQDTYEFAQPLPAPEVQPIFTSDPVVQPVAQTVEPAYRYRSAPVVQDIPAPPPPAAYHGSPEATAGYGHGGHEVYEVETVQMPHEAAHAGHVATHPPQAHHAVPHSAPVHHATPYPATPYPAAHAGPPLPPQASYDRDSWLDNCESELRRRKNAGAAGGGLLGAIAGGIIGNRVADGERLGGTLLGAGIGGIAGAAIGSAIGSAVRGNPYLRECKAWLENYENGNYSNYGQAYGYGYPQGSYGYQHGGYGYAQHGYGYYYAPATAYVTTYAIERPVVREYVTEEWVDVPVEHHVEYETEVHHTPAPPPAPRYIKGKTRYIKGN